MTAFWKSSAFCLLSAITTKFCLRVASEFCQVIIQAVRMMYPGHFIYDVEGGCADFVTHAIHLMSGEWPSTGVSSVSVGDRVHVCYVSDACFVGRYTVAWKVALRRAPTTCP